MAKKKTKKSNDTAKLPDKSMIEEMAGELIAAKQGKKNPREDIFFLYYLAGYDVPTSGKLAGYSPSYADCKLTRKVKNSAKLREKLGEILSLLPDQYRQWCRARLLDVVQIDRGVLEKLKAEPELAIKHPRALRQIKESAGVLEEEQPRVPAINISEMRLAQNITYQLIQGEADPTANLKEVKPGVYEIEQEPGDDTNE